MPGVFRTSRLVVTRLGLYHEGTSILINQNKSGTASPVSLGSETWLRRSTPGRKARRRKRQGSSHDY